MVPKKTKEKKKRPSKGVMKERKKEVLSSLQHLGGEVYEQLAKKEFPTVKMPSRSIANILYDKKTRQYILGNRSVKRSARNVRHIRPLRALRFTLLLPRMYWRGFLLLRMVGKNRKAKRRTPVNTA